MKLSLGSHILLVENLPVGITDFGDSFCVNHVPHLRSYFRIPFCCTTWTDLLHFLRGAVRNPILSDDDSHCDRLAGYQAIETRGRDWARAVDTVKQFVISRLYFLRAGSFTELGPNNRFDCLNNWMSHCLKEKKKKRAQARIHTSQPYSDGTGMVRPRASSSFTGACAHVNWRCGIGSLSLSSTKVDIKAASDFLWSCVNYSDFMSIIYQGSPSVAHYTEQFIQLW